MGDLLSSTYIPENNRLNMEIILGSEFDISEYPNVVFGTMIAERGLQFIGSFVQHFAKPSDFNSFNDVDGWHVVVSNFSYGTSCGMYLIESATGCIFIANTRTDKIYFNIAAPNAAIAEAEQQVIKKIFPVEPIRMDPENVPMGIWSLGAHGPVQRNRDMVPLMWPDIQKNYTETTRKKLEALLDVHPPMDGGRLILWHGSPGVGKTSAIRSLMFNWLPWCNTSYVVDPEQFFGSAAYMLSVILDAEASKPDWDFDGEDARAKTLKKDFYTITGKGRWNLLIVEDADEFLTTNAKDRTGQALSRLLNLSDGLIGQGLNFLILITTNELLNNVHKAVSREGRCMSNIEFGSFTKREAMDWLGSEDAHHINTDTREEWTLAQLYDFRHEISQIKNDLRVPVSTGQYL